MLSQGQITDVHLKAALKAQRDAGTGRVGDWLIRQGVVTEQQITAALGSQWSCPIYPLDMERLTPQVTQMVPLPLLESSNMVPAHYLAPNRLLYVAFSDWVDYIALYAVEQVLDCRTEACVADQSTMEEAMELIRNQPRPQEQLFEDLKEPQELARITCDRAFEVGAEDVRLVGCGEYLWARLVGAESASNLVFQVMED